MSKRRVFTQKLAGLLYSSVAGGEGDPTGRSADVRQLLLAAYGRGPRGGVNTAAAAQGLGVTQRSVERWLKGERKTNPTSMAALREQARETTKTKAGRQRAIAGARRPRRDAVLHIDGYQGPTGYDDERHRGLTLQLTPDQVDQLRTAYVNGGDRAAIRWLANHTSQNYLEGWSFHSIDNVSLQL